MTIGWLTHTIWPGTLEETMMWETRKIAHQSRPRMVRHSHLVVVMFSELIMEWWGGVKCCVSRIYSRLNSFFIYDGHKRFAQMLTFLHNACSGVSILCIISCLERRQWLSEMKNVCVRIKERETETERKIKWVKDTESKGRFCGVGFLLYQYRNDA